MSKKDKLKNDLAEIDEFLGFNDNKRFRVEFRHFIDTKGVWTVLNSYDSMEDANKAHGVAKKRCYKSRIFDKDQRVAHNTTTNNI